MVQPDLVYLSAARRSLAGERIEGAPELVVEVISPRSARLDRGEKLKLYAASGVREYWIVDPPAQQIEFLVCREGRFQVILPEAGTYRSETLPELTLDLDAFWAEVAAQVG